MEIKNWILKTADDIGEVEEKEDHEVYKTKDGRLIEFGDKVFEELRQKLIKGELSEEEQATVSEIEYLLDTAKVATARMLDNMGSPSDKEGATKTLPENPAEVGEVPPALPSKREPTKIPPKIKEPETTKWKEIRFNKRTGSWQVVVTQRHTRNFASEDEAITYTRKAELDDSGTKEKVS